VITLTVIAVVFLYKCQCYKSMSRNGEDF